MLQSVGISEEEERVYEALLTRPPLTAPAVAQIAQVPAPQARKILLRLEQNGLVSRSAEKRPRYIVTPPDVAIEALALRRQAELDEARATAHRLEQRFRARSVTTSPNELVEIVTPREAVARRVEQLQRSAHDEILFFVKRPYVVSRGDNAPVENELLQRGVRYRSVYERAILEEPGAAEELLRCAESEELRVLHPVRMKLLIVDRRIGLIPLTLGQSPVDESALLVHSSTLLEALVAMWESAWERATPIEAVKAMDVDGGAGRLSPGDEQLVTLLLAGLKTQAIARHLGVGLSTVDRRVRRVMDILGAETRFQAGYQLALRRLREEADDGPL